MAQAEIPQTVLAPGMGFVGGPEGVVRVSEAAGWMRIDARYGAVVRRRTTALPLLF